MACAASAGLVALIMLAHPPVVHMSRELAIQQLSLIGIGLLVMLLLIASLVVLMRLRRRVKLIHQVIGQFTRPHFSARILDVHPSDDLGVLEHRLNILMDTIDVYVRQGRAEIKIQNNAEYYQAIMTSSLMHALRERGENEIFTYDELILSGEAMNPIEIADQDVIEGEQSVTPSELSDGEIFTSLEDFEFEADSKAENEVEEAEPKGRVNERRKPLSYPQAIPVESKPVLKGQEMFSEESIVFDVLEPLEDVSDEFETPDGSKPAFESSTRSINHKKSVDDKEPEDDFTRELIASIAKFSTLSSYIRDALEKFYLSAKTHENKSSEKMLHVRERLKVVNKEMAKQVKMKQELGAIIDELPIDDSDMWDNATIDDDSAQPKRVLQRGIEQVSVMAKQVRMYTLGALAQAEKLGGDGARFKEAAEEIRSLAGESAEAAVEMREALEKYDGTIATMEIERDALVSLMERLRESLESMELSQPIDGESRGGADGEADTEVKGDAGQKVDIEEMMSVLRAATAAMIDESEELKAQLSKEAA